MNLKIDEELKNLIPPLTSEEFRQLEKNILKDGCRDPLVTWGGYIVDGHNRYRICQENNIPFQTIEKEFSDKEEVIQWVILNQFGRRNLNNFQRGELALRLKPMVREIAREKQHTSTGGNAPQLLQISVEAEKKINTQQELAKIADVSHDTIMKVEKIKEKGTADQIARARKGGKGNSINSVYKEVKENEVEMKTCTKCKKNLPVASFYKGKGECKTCHDSIKYYKNVKGDIYKVPPEIRKMSEADIIGDLYDVDKVIVHTIDDAIEAFEANYKTFWNTLDGILSNYLELIKQPENNKKIIAVLSEAEAAMIELKGKYLYE